MAKWKHKGGFDVYEKQSNGNALGWIIGIAFVLILLAAA